MIMDPSNAQQSGFEVPPHRPAGDMIPLTPNSLDPESAGSLEPLLPPTQPAGAVPPMAPPLSPIVAAPLPPTGAAASATHSIHPAAPPTADDIDLIEKEWVDKAKAIVAQTRTDPHAQNQQMNRFKADYMKKRYNKEIKLNES
jgi:hypothetical protein